MTEITPAGTRVEYALSTDLSVAGSDARSYVREALVGAADEVRDIALLLTSELVSNAGLHGSPPVVLAIDCDGSLIRVEVADAGTMPPTVKPYGPAARTGRGLRMLEALAARWGWNPSGSGKTVWFELAQDGLWGAGTHEKMTRPTDMSALHPYPLGIEILLAQMPVRLMIQSGESYDGMYRALRTRTRDGGLRRDDGAPVHLLQLLDELAIQFRGFGQDPEDVWELAVQTGLEHVDLHFRLPQEAEPVIDRYGQLLDGAEEYCRKWLPSVAPVEEACVLRRWIFEEVSRQLRGEQPRPWIGGSR